MTGDSPLLNDYLQYARSLHAYASPRLDDFNLRCWIIHRLMLDAGLEHDEAASTFERAHELAAGPVRARPRRLGHRPQLVRTIVRPARARAVRPPRSRGRKRATA
jgi:hypothetical protein